MLTQHSNVLVVVAFRRSRSCFKMAFWRSYKSFTRHTLNYKTIIYTAAALSISPFSLCAKNSCSSEKGCNDEVKNAILADEARKANPAGPQVFETVFAKILRKEIKADIVFEDDKVINNFIQRYFIPD